VPPQQLHPAATQVRAKSSSRPAHNDDTPTPFPALNPRLGAMRQKAHQAQALSRNGKPQSSGFTQALHRIGAGHFAKWPWIESVGRNGRFGTQFAISQGIGPLNQGRQTKGESVMKSTVPSQNLPLPYVPELPAEFIRMLQSGKH
jgi:hypothetical protein